MRVSADEIVGAARAWLGTPYRHQASTLGAGCDCLGLLRGVWRALYGAEAVEVRPYRADGRGADLLAGAERWLVRADEPAAGRVVLFRLGRQTAPRHCAIMVSETRFIHAQERLGVVEANMTDGWRRRAAAIFEFPE
jgi:NlpC/P60 family putative phage cell wall peptidase